MVTDKPKEEEDKFYKKPPRGIQINNAFLLNCNSILVEEKNLEGDKSKVSNNYWYSRLSYLGKKFFRKTKKNSA